MHFCPLKLRTSDKVFRTLVVILKGSLLATLLNPLSFILFLLPSRVSQMCIVRRADRGRHQCFFIPGIIVYSLLTLYYCSLSITLSSYLNST